MKRLKNILLFLLIFAAAAAAYLFLRKPETKPLVVAPTAPVTPGTGTAQTAIGQEFLNMLLSLKDIRLDPDFFQNPTFQALRDFSIPIARLPGSEGRPNPFAPLEEEKRTVVETQEATLIGATQATLNGLVSLPFVNAPKLFSWGLTPDLPNRTEIITEATAMGFFSQTLTDLLPQTTYFFRAEVISGRETISGEIFSFTTLPL